jgi:hypothetical protein
LIVGFTAERIIWLQKQMAAVMASLNNEALEFSARALQLKPLLQNGF